MKRPNLKLPSGPKLSASPKLPPFVENLFRDLRDKRLLPAVCVLLLGIVVVPFALGGAPDPEPGSGATVSGVEALGDASGVPAEAQPVVLAEAPVLRDFRKRLDSFRKRNPFKQQLTAAPPGLSAPEATLAPASTDDGSGGGSTSGELAETIEQLDEPVSTPPSSDSSLTTDTGGGSPSGSGSSSSGGNGGGKGGNGGDGGGKSKGGSGEDKLVVYSWTISARTGPKGDGKGVKDVASLDFLPNPDKPIAQFIRGDLAETEAAFVVSRKVDSTSGDGTCDPSPQDCQFLLLEVGQEQRFVYEPDGKTYVLELKKVKLHEKVLDATAAAAREVAAGAGGYADVILSVQG